MGLCFFISHLFDVGFLMSLFEERYHLIMPSRSRRAISSSIFSTEFFQRMLYFRLRDLCSVLSSRFIDCTFSGWGQNGSGTKISFLLSVCHWGRSLASVWSVLWTILSEHVVLGCGDDNDIVWMCDCFRRFISSVELGDLCFTLDSFRYEKLWQFHMKWSPWHVFWTTDYTHHDFLTQRQLSKERIS